MLAVIAIIVALVMGGIILFNFVLKKFVYPLDYKEHVFYYADEFGVERALVFSVIKTESGFDKRAVSSKGAIGLMQITPKTGDFIASLIGDKEYDLYNAETNVKYGTFYLRYLQNKFQDMQTVLCAYNAGEGNTSKWLSSAEYSDDGVTLNKIPYHETQEYVKKTCESFRKYQKLYGDILDKTK